MANDCLPEVFTKQRNGLITETDTWWLKSVTFCSVRVISQVFFLPATVKFKAKGRPLLARHMTFWDVWPSGTYDPQGPMTLCNKWVMTLWDEWPSGSRWPSWTDDPLGPSGTDDSLGRMILCDILGRMILWDGWPSATNDSLGLMTLRKRMIL